MTFWSRNNPPPGGRDRSTRPRTFRPRLEWLENRLVPSVDLGAVSSLATAPVTPATTEQTTEPCPESSTEVSSPGVTAAPATVANGGAMPPMGPVLADPNYPLQQHASALYPVSPSVTQATTGLPVIQTAEVMSAHVRDIGTPLPGGNRDPAEDEEATGERNGSPAPFVTEKRIVASQTPQSLAELEGEAALKEYLNSQEPELPPSPQLFPDGSIPWVPELPRAAPAADGGGLPGADLIIVPHLRNGGVLNGGAGTTVTSPPETPAEYRPETLLDSVLKGLEQTPGWLQMLSTENTSAPGVVGEPDRNDQPAVESAAGHLGPLHVALAAIPFVGAVRLTAEREVKTSEPPGVSRRPARQG